MVFVIKFEILRTHHLQGVQLEYELLYNFHNVKITSHLLLN